MNDWLMAVILKKWIMSSFFLCRFLFSKFAIRKSFQNEENWDSAPFICVERKKKHINEEMRFPLCKICETGHTACL